MRTTVKIEIKSNEFTLEVEEYLQESYTLPMRPEELDIAIENILDNAVNRIKKGLRR